MLKSKIVLSLLMLFLVAGCNVFGKKNISEMDPAELPDVIAFQDDFTREFMSSLDEVEEGYYLFESKTGNYTMIFPENAVMDQLYFEMPGEEFEAISFGENEETSDYVYYVRATYKEASSIRDPEALQKVLSTQVSYEGDYEPIEYDDKTIYFATTEYVTRSGNSKSDRFLAVIMSNISEQSVSIRYNVISDNDNSNNIDLEAIQNEVIKIMESIEFK